MAFPAKRKILTTWFQRLKTIIGRGQRKTSSTDRRVQWKTSLKYKYQSPRPGKGGLNTYSHNCAISIIRHFLSQGLNVRRAYLDTVGDEVKYKELLDQTFNQGMEKIEFTVCSKADDLFPVVSAASIVAKVTRDNNVKNTSMKEKVTITTEFGSGYPSDPTTVKWLNDNFQSFFGYPSVVRFSWSTIANRLTDSKLEYTFHANLPEEVHTFQSKPGPNDPKRGKLNLRLHLKNEFAL